MIPEKDDWEKLSMGVTGTVAGGAPGMSDICPALLVLKPGFGL